MQVSWRKALDLPFDWDCCRQLRDYFDAFNAQSDSEDVPPRLLAPGPKNNQVIIFQAKGPLPATERSLYLVVGQLLGNHLAWRKWVNLVLVQFTGVS